MFTDNHNKGVVRQSDSEAAERNEYDIVRASQKSFFSTLKPQRLSMKALKAERIMLRRRKLIAARTDNNKLA